MRMRPRLLAMLLTSLSLPVLAQSAPIRTANDSDAGAPAQLPVAEQRQIGKTSLYRNDDISTTQRHWYGWQTLSTDAAAIGFSITAAVLHGNDRIQTPLMLIAAGSYLLGGPIVHFAHGHQGKGFLSLAMRLGLPVVAGGTMALAPNCRSGDCLGGGLLMVGAGLLGMIASSAIDAAAIAREDVPREVAFAPVVQVGKNGGTVGVAGRF